MKGGWNLPIKNFISLFTRTNLTGLLKGDGTNIAVAEAGTDYLVDETDPLSLHLDQATPQPTQELVPELTDEYISIRDGALIRTPLSELPAGDSHPAVTIDPASAALASIDPVTQVLTIEEQGGLGAETDPVFTAWAAGFEVNIKFETIGSWTYICPHAMKVTSVARSQVNAPTLNPVVNTDRTQYQTITVTVDEVGLVILTCVWL